MLGCARFFLNRFIQKTRIACSVPHAMHAACNMQRADDGTTGASISQSPSPSGVGHVLGRQAGRLLIRQLIRQAGRKEGRQTINQFIRQAGTQAGSQAGY